MRHVNNNNPIQMSSNHKSKSKPKSSSLETEVGPIQIQPYPLAPGSRFMAGSSNTFWYCNIDTGVWIHGGTQQLMHSRRSDLTFGDNDGALSTSFINILEFSN